MTVKPERVIVLLAGQIVELDALLGKNGVEPQFP